MTSISSKQRGSFEASYRKPRIIPGKRAGEVRVIFRAYGIFPVSLFDGTRAELTLFVDGIDTPVAGTLHEVKRKHARGTRYEFIFQADQAEALQQVRFSGEIHFSNIRRIDFELPGCTRFAENPYFKPLS